jgi:hypothetical protein
MENVPSTVIVIWWIALILTVLVVLPLAVYLLQRTLTAARQIEGNLARARDAGVGISRNTAETRQLNTTLEAAPVLIDSASNIRTGSEALTRTLVGRLEGREP